MKETARVLYLTPGCFDKGGFSRYSRYQIRCLRDWLGTIMFECFTHGPDEHSLETPMDVWWHGKSTRTIDKLGFAFRALLSSLSWRTKRRSFSTCALFSTLSVLVSIVWFEDAAQCLRP